MKSFLCIPLLLFTVGVYGQKISHQVLVPAAGLVTAGGISYQQTIGETAVELFVIPSYALTQGFQQPLPLKGDDPVPGVSGVAVFPNPVSKDCSNELKVQLKSLESRSYTVVIFNFAGSVVYKWKSGMVIDDLETIHLDSFARGVYIVRIISSDGEIDRSFKIEKL